MKHKLDYIKKYKEIMLVTRKPKMKPRGLYKFGLPYLHTYTYHTVINTF